MPVMNWVCTCGQVQFGVRAPVSYIVCYCESCQAFSKGLGRSELLDPAGGSHLCQVRPDHIEMTAGQNQIGSLQVTENGPLRWYTRCCNTPICNTARSRRLPFASFGLHGFEEPELAGPVIARANRRHATGHIDGDGGRVSTIIWRFIKGTFVTYALGRLGKNPFFKPSGDPIATPEPIRLVSERLNNG